MFKNEKLTSIINKMPATAEKLPLTMLFVLVDGYLSGTLSESNFLNDLKVLLNDKN